MAEPAAHTEVPAEGHKAGFPPFQRDTFASQLVWLAITFVVLYALVAKLALPRVGGIFAARRERVESDLAQARGLREEADAALAAYEKAIAATKQSAMANVRTIAADAAAAIVERLIGAAPSQPAVAAAVDDALKR